jgi:Topoisomerase IA
MSEYLFVIEAPGKTGTLANSLRRLGFNDFRIEPTVGHLFAMPKSLSPLGIDLNFQERLRAFRNLETGERVTRAISSCEKLFIATDPDHEGEVIANDINTLAILTGFDGEIWRIRLGGLDPANVKQAILAKEPVNRTMAIPGRSRAIVDRIIGHTFSHDGIAAGRVLTPTLQLAASSDPVVAEMVLRLPADEGEDYVATIQIRRSRLEEAAELAHRFMQTRFMPARTAGRVQTVFEMPDMADILFESSRRLGLKVVETARIMQQMYMRGRLSYPRSLGKHIGPVGIQAANRLARQSGLRFDPERLNNSQPQKMTHESPHVLDAEVTLGGRLDEMLPEQAVMCMIGRMTVRCGQDVQREYASKADLPDFLAEKLKMTEFTRDTGWRMPEVAEQRPTGLYLLSKDAALLQLMKENGLGRPSTWPDHIDRMISRDLLGDHLFLSPRGQAWLENTDPCLRDVTIAKRLETMIEKPVITTTDHEPWCHNARMVCEALGSSPFKQVIQNVETELEKLQAEPVFQPMAA